MASSADRLGNVSQKKSNFNILKTMEIKGIYLIERIEASYNEKKYYVGQANDIFNRLNQHCTQRNPGIDNAIAELGSDKFSFRILEIVKRTKDLNACETEWINKYKKLYGDEQMYNIAQTTNVRTTINPQIKAKIKKLLEEDLGRSIYAIAEHFDMSYKDVIDIRKPLLKKHGLIWKDGRIINKITGEEPNNWRGYQFTEVLANRVRTILGTPDYSEKDVRFVSQSDLEIFLKSGDNYCYAPEIEEK